MSTGLDNLKHIVVLMMSGRSFDHMLGALNGVDPRINGLTGNESNPDTTGAIIKVQPNAKFQGQLEVDPDHHFPGVDFQIFGGAAPGPGRIANMQGFIKSYAAEGVDIGASHAVMSYFPLERLPVLTRLATEYAVFNGWFSSVPGPTIPNRAFAHYGTSFGQVDMNFFHVTDPTRSVYERLIKARQTAKIYYYDQQSSILAAANLMKNYPRIFSTYIQFIADCISGTLPAYSFIEPNHNDRVGPDGGVILASDQYPDHNVQEGERFIANTYNAIRTNPTLWETTAMLVLYDEHGGIYDHVVPPVCQPDDYSAPAAKTGIGEAFHFDRLGIRVPAILISPYIPRGTVVPGPEEPNNGLVFEHACIPRTVTDFFLGDSGQHTIREKNSNNFLTPLSDTLRPEDDCYVFEV